MDAIISVFAMSAENLPRKTFSNNITPTQSRQVVSFKRLIIGKVILMSFCAMSALIINNYMKKIIENLAHIFLMEYAKTKKIDVSGTHLVKNGRGYNYSLVSDDTGRAIITICLHKSSVPTYFIHN